MFMFIIVPILVYLLLNYLLKITHVSVNSWEVGKYRDEIVHINGKIYRKFDYRIYDRIILIFISLIPIVNVIAVVVYFLIGVAWGCVPYCEKEKRNKFINFLNKKI